MTSSSQTPRCLVLLASCNGSDYIQQQLESILAQQGVDVEVLIGDDASTDATVSIARSLNSAGNIRVLTREAGTGSAAQNFADLFRVADTSGFDYIAFSDQDDIWMPGKLQRAATTLSSCGTGGYSCSVIARWPTGAESVFRQSAARRSADFLFEGGGQGCSFVVTRSLFEKVQQLFRARPDLTATLIYHDWAVYALARSLDVSWTFDAEPFIIYRQHGANDTGARGSIAGIRKRLRLFMGGQYRKQVATIARLCLEVAPGNSLLRRWMELELATSTIRRRIAVALFCFRHGRRRPLDRTLTSLAAIAGWI